MIDYEKKNKELETLNREFITEINELMDKLYNVCCKYIRGEITLDEAKIMTLRNSFFFDFYLKDIIDIDVYNTTKHRSVSHYNKMVAKHKNKELNLDEFLVNTEYSENEDDYNE